MSFTRTLSRQLDELVQAEVEKTLLGYVPDIAMPELHKRKARLEIVADFEDLKVIRKVLGELAIKK